jgi:hypothetical protein
MIIFLNVTVQMGIEIIRLDLKQITDFEARSRFGLLNKEKVCPLAENFCKKNPTRRHQGKFLLQLQISTIKVCT